ncbi:MAG: hypothetical protein H6712_18305 [Myxococcales bacterium]|nr:hypothetical protein [Myxococcales bacterium]MCB9715826.1 hypothetical protein [Myxococcales bacterium]
MHHLATILRSFRLRSSGVLAILALGGCDEPDSELGEPEELELRDGLPITAGIPTDDPVKVSFSIPLQPVGELKPKSGFSLHGPTDLAYLWTPDPAGDPDMILVDANGVSPYSNNLPYVPQSVCDGFLQQYPYDVPVLDSLDSCSDVELGCCDRVCYLWGGVAAEFEGDNVTYPVDNYTFIDTEMVWGSYVGMGHLDWNANLPNGGHSERETVCGCLCVRDEEE